MTGICNNKSNENEFTKESLGNKCIHVVKMNNDIKNHEDKILKKE